MPTFETAMARANVSLVDGILLTDSQRYAVAQANEFTDLFAALEIPLSTGFVEHALLFPQRVRVAILAAVRDALNDALPITLAWQAGYDCAVDIRESFNTADTKGRLTIVVTGPYPADLARRVRASQTSS